MSYLKAIREELKLSQSGLAEKLGISRSLVCKWDSGVSSMTITSAELYSRRTGVPISRLLEGKEPFAVTVKMKAIVTPYAGGFGVKTVAGTDIRQDITVEDIKLIKRIIE
jgi:transcriptional regulator with XRE-family HTH domain